MSQGQEQGENSYSGKAQFLFIVPLIGIFLLGFAWVGSGSTTPYNSSEQFLGQVSASQAPLPEDPQLVLVGNNALSAFSPPVAVTPQVLGAILGQPEEDRGPEITKYVVEEGDTPSSVAEKFGISMATVLGANDLSSRASLKPGKEILILPVSGALHLVRPGDTLSEIATWYKGSSYEITEFNSLTVGQIFAGDLVIIPGGVKPISIPSGRLTPIANSYFIWPIPAPHPLTQGLHPFNAVDMSNGICGEPVYAAAGGNIQKTGYTSLGGNYVRVLHPNGVVTYSGHLSRILTTIDTKVFQGQIIGYTGNTGFTIGRTGCHLHFEVRGAVNPFAR